MSSGSWVKRRPSLTRQQPRDPVTGFRLGNCIVDQKNYLSLREIGVCRLTEYSGPGRLFAIRQV